MLASLVYAVCPQRRATLPAVGSDFPARFGVKPRRVSERLSRAEYPSEVDVRIPLVVCGDGPLFLPVRGIGVRGRAVSGDLVKLGRFNVLRQVGCFADLEALFDSVGDRNLVVDRIVGRQFGVHESKVPYGAPRETLDMRF